MNVDAIDSGIVFSVHGFLANCLNSPTQWSKTDIVHSEVGRKKKRKRKRTEEGSGRASNGDKDSVKRNRKEGDRETATSDKGPTGKKDSTHIKRKKMTMKAEDVKVCVSYV